MEATKDPIGMAIWDYYLNDNPIDIIVECDIMEDDFIPVDYLFRKYKDFPTIEKKAMEYCEGKILDVGAAAGPHTKYLLDKGFDVTTVEVSPNAHRYLIKELPAGKHYLTPILNFNDGKYDTILLMMNGIGLSEDFDGVVPFLKHLASLLSDSGSILAESTDVYDIFEDEDGGLWVDLNTRYYGEFNFNMKYKNVESGWFKWLYLDENNFIKFAEEAGLKAEILLNEENSFLIQLKKQN